MILVLDNRDSFTFNLVQYLLELGAEVRVERAAELDARSVLELGPAGILIGPGPGRPEKAGCSEALVRELVHHPLPVLGVCLGHQVLATAFGGAVLRSGDLAHGQTRAVRHDGRGVFRGLPNPVRATRYNSLAVDPGRLPECLLVSATAEGGEIMGLRHRSLPFEGVQFHPEAVLPEAGRDLLGNFLAGPGAVSRG